MAINRGENPTKEKKKRQQQFLMNCVNIIS